MAAWRGASGALAAQPDGRRDHREQSDPPEEEAFTDGAEVAQVVTATVLVLVERLHEGDDVVLASGEMFWSLKTGIDWEPLTMTS